MYYYDYYLILTLIHPASPMHRATRWCHECLSWADASTFSQVNPILWRSFFTTSLQFILGLPGFFLNPATSQCSACFGVRTSSILVTWPSHCILLSRITFSRSIFLSWADASTSSNLLFIITYTIIYYYKRVQQSTVETRTINVLFTDTVNIIIIIHIIRHSVQWLSAAGPPLILYNINNHFTLSHHSHIQLLKGEPLVKAKLIHLNTEQL